jgi:hypothetical protein
MNHRPIDTLDDTTVKLRVRVPLVERQDPPVEVRPPVPQSGWWLARVVKRFRDGAPEVVAAPKLDPRIQSS